MVLVCSLSDPIIMGTYWTRQVAQFHQGSCTYCIKVVGSRYKRLVVTHVHNSKWAWAQERYHLHLDWGGSDYSRNLLSLLTGTACLHPLSLQLQLYLGIFDGRFCMQQTLLTCSPEKKKQVGVHCFQPCINSVLSLYICVPHKGKWMWK